MTDKDQQLVEEEYLEEQDDIQEEQELASTEQPLKQSTPTNRAAKVWMIASIVLFAALIYAIIQPPFNESSETIASVNGVSISKDMLYDEMIKTGGAPILDNMIIEELLDQEAEETGVKVTDSDVESEISMIKKGFPTEEEWTTALAQNGTTEEKLRIDIVKQVQMRKLLEPQTPVTDEEIKLFFEENLEAMSTPDKTPTLDEKKEEIRYQLIYQKVSELAPSWIEEIKAKAEIENSLEVK
ncbi:MAG: SurA N-terminal domain-containing protein [Paenibacillaceae bacterium]